ncbi:nuclease-related domain-containing protein [Edaphobacillus lindanitolerans]|uniref:Nuclease-related domain-containing protein n=1 Tax=Edaphobacillus lindanitolerans TaxID=550447 RepID=A0A1U7PM74_9BACI|nr:nuclease-related domain-containing protein [Edaphobacillus lindanitolerans]SIT69639.1 Nuclease-related domain-containing protein [Edaphobacillus lindanitolerans]
MNRSFSELNRYGLKRILMRANLQQHRKMSDIRFRLYTLGAGIAGEQKVLDYLKNLRFGFPFRVLWDIRLEVSSRQYVQIDLLVLTPTRAIIYEVKNIGGRLRFEDNPARLDKVDADGFISDSFECPVLQLEEEMAGLRQWLEMNRISSTVDGAVVMTANPVFEQAKKDGRVFRLREIRRHLATERTGPSGRSGPQIEELAKLFMRAHEPYFPFPLRNQFNIQENELYWGPICSDCGELVIRKSERTWICRACGTRCKNVFEETLLDWFLLKGRLISSEDIRHLFSLADRRSASWIIRRFELDRIQDSRLVLYSWDYSALRLPYRLNE